MWKRATWHECADELDQVCRRFRRAYWGYRSQGWPRHPADEADMKESSVEGIKLLRALALAVRSEQDFDLAPNPTSVVGALKNAKALRTDATSVKHCGGYENMLAVDGYAPLTLRQALNKIAHADPQTADYFVGPSDDSHDILLYGEDRGRNWFAAVSILELVKVIRNLPDTNVVT
jgi:hypothetical protein